MAGVGSNFFMATSHIELALNVLNYRKRTGLH